jgi:GNAT superfamily N-acetyltransferase
MEKLSIYRSNQELPAILACQINTYIRVEWPTAPDIARHIHDPVRLEHLHPAHLVIAEDETVIAYASVMWKMLEHGGQTYRMYGIGAVFTFPTHRGLGYGRRIAEAATEYIDQTGLADLAILFTYEHLIRFYATLGWEYMPTTTMLKGERDNPVAEETKTMMRFISLQGQGGRESFENNQVYFGAMLW